MTNKQKPAKQQGNEKQEAAAGSAASAPESQEVEREQQEKLIVAARAGANGLTLVPKGKVKGNHTVEKVEPETVDPVSQKVVCKFVG